MPEKPLLNTLRWASAALVLVGHAAAWTFRLFLTTPISPGLLEIPKYFVDLGHSAVMVFFVVSGYLVGGGALRSADNFDLRRYSIARFTRIYVVIVPALFLTAGLDGAAYLMDRANPIYAAPWGWITKPVFSGYGSHEILASVTSLESIVGDPMGSDRPLWSLGFEWLFYFLLPLGLVVARRLTTSSIGRLAICATLGLPLAAVHMRWAALYWFIWLSGAAASLISAPRSLALVGLTVWVVSFAASPLMSAGVSDLLEGFGLACFIAWPPAMALHLNKTLDHRLADLSYSLYVTHMPVLTFAVFCFWRAGLFPIDRLAFGLAGFGWVVVFVGLAFAMAVIFSKLFEERTDAARRLLSVWIAPIGAGRP